MRNKLTYANVAATIALVLAVAGGGSAVAEPVASSVASAAQGGASLAKRALGISQRADRRSVRALQGTRLAIGAVRSGNENAARARVAADSALRTASNAMGTARANGEAAEEASSEAAEAGEAAQAAMDRARQSLTETESDDRYLSKGDQAAGSALLDGLGPGEFARSASFDTGGPIEFSPTSDHDCHEASPAVSVTVDVPSHGLVAVYAEAKITAAGSNGLGVQLHEPNVYPGCLRLLFESTPGQVLRKTMSQTTIGRTGEKGDLTILRLEPGETTISLRYLQVGGSGSTNSSLTDMLLYVRPL